MMSLKRLAAFISNEKMDQARTSSSRDTEREIDSFIGPFMYPGGDNFYINTTKPPIHSNRLSILFPARLCLFMCGIIKISFSTMSQKSIFVRQ